ncbi:uncharacterized protein LOC115883280 [Sitophilus oryzae]|uniref:Uncharacterized protein LOC115883280 n=1 Tax=Sitophilus oryzae TaxID=7048 RepID=A0A6J2Y2G5_SITOR|nr:uncharacterized protein LOC115883280 [Sitophilus oryzae]
MFTCSSCQKAFSRKDNLTRHLKNACKKSSFLNRFLGRSAAEEKKKYCSECKEHILQNLWVGHLRSNSHKNNCKTLEEKGIQVIKSAFKERIISYRLSTEENILNVKNYFKILEQKILRVFDNQLKKHTCIKVNIELFGYYYNPSNDNHDVKSFNTPFKVICNSSATKDLVEDFLTIIENKADEFTEKDSEHDIAYSQTEDLLKDATDKLLGDQAWNRVKAKDSSLSEKVAALTVAAIMKGKRKLGMGIKKKKEKKVESLT